MKKFCYSICVFLFVAVNSALAQKIVEGDKTLAFLKGTTKLNLDYDDAWMTLGKENKSEDKYLEEMLMKLNQKKPGKGDRWVEKWKNDKISRYVAFESALNLELSKSNVMAARQADGSKYTIRLKLLNFDPGAAGSIKVQPTCKFEMAWVDIATGIVAAKGTLTITDQKAEVTKKDYDPMEAVRECYLKCGKELGMGMAKKMK